MEGAPGEILPFWVIWVIRIGTLAERLLAA
jgi:hypothetical protein